MTNLQSLGNFILRQSAPPIILCIGSTRVPGDCFGPMTGQLLCDFFKIPTDIYGTMKKPVHALNFEQTLSEINVIHQKRKIIAVDSALCPSVRKGTLCIFPGPLKPGLATGKDLTPVGDFSVTATVGRASKAELFSANTEYVYNLALKASLIIRRAFGSGKSRSGDRLLLSL